ncbi:hypothetical protein AGMMS50229_18060 [Campylobacterota bacterium]|nr:hypothetical protein AGMMS50229_18060 [Campylobacterota bacterium]
MRRLSDRIGKQLISIFSLSIALFAIATYFLCKDIEMKRYEDMLIISLKTVKASLKSSDHFQDFCDDFHKNTDMRMTIVDIDGKVLADSELKASEMENHAKRIEIYEARFNEYGFAQRRSASTDVDLLYAATKIAIDDQEYFVRINAQLDDILRSFYLIWIGVLVIFVLAVALLAFSFSALNKKIRLEIVKIYSAFLALENKDYNIDLGLPFSKEFYEIGLFIKKFAKKLQKRDKQKRKYTAKLKLASQQKSAIISAISHEFKNPIAVLIGYAQTLIENDDLDRNIRIKFCEKIVKNSQKISDTIDRLALSVKLEMGELSLKKTDFDLHELTKEIVNGFTLSNPKREIIYGGDPIMINADKQMMESVIVNLIDNAIKYSDIYIVVTLQNGKFSVIDKGIGIAQNEIENIVKKFYRATSGNRANSLGLGLSFVSDILRLHDMKLEIKSEINNGSIFSFDLPK